MFNTTVVDNEVLSNISKSVDGLRQHFTLNSMKIPHISSYSSINKFISEFEEATLNVPDNQKVKLVAQSFKHGPHHPWYELTLKPLVEKQESWSSIKKAIKSRFCVTEEREAHLERMRDLRFDINGSQKLLDYVEEMNFTFSKAFPGYDEESCIKFIKTSLPASVRSQLDIYAESRQCSTLENLKQAARTYDELQGHTSTLKREGLVKSEDLANLFHKLIADVKSEVRREVAAAVTFQRSTSPYSGSRDSRSPYRSQNNRYQQAYSPKRAYSPANRAASPKPQQSTTSQVNNKITAQPNTPFDFDKYYAKFGVPPGPCNSCGMMHWSRHCQQLSIDHLN